MSDPSIQKGTPASGVGSSGTSDAGAHHRQVYDTVGQTERLRERPGVWVIDVCRTCGRLATWPFCEHKPASLAWDGSHGIPWYEPVRVKEVGR